VTSVLSEEWMTCWSRVEFQDLWSWMASSAHPSVRVPNQAKWFGVMKDQAGRKHQRSSPAQQTEASVEGVSFRPISVRHFQRV